MGQDTCSLLSAAAILVLLFIVLTIWLYQKSSHKLGALGGSVSAHRAVRYPANDFCRTLKELNWIVYCPFYVVQGRWKEERRGIPYLQPLSCCSSVSPGTQLLSWMAAKSMLWVRDTRKHLKLNQQKTNTQTTKPTMWKCTADVILYLRTFVGNFQNWD